MHHKYAVRDGEAVWTGSMNWTDDSFAIQENVLATVDRPSVAARVRARLRAALDDRRSSSRAGCVEPRAARRRRRAACAPGSRPGFGEELSHRIAKRDRPRERRVRICSPVITTAPVLATLAQLVSEGERRRRRLRRRAAGARRHLPVARERQRLLEAAAAASRCCAARFSGKPSTPWQPDGHAARLHAREGDRRRRRRLPRQLQPLALGRAERRERARDRRRGARRAARRRTSTRCARSIRRSSP